jgi:carboxyl-terminal processing protease
MKLVNTLNKIFYRMGKGMKRRGFTIGIIVLLIIGALVALETDPYKAIGTNLRIHKEVVDKLLREYVDDIDGAALISAGIEGMLKELDPYTVFIRQEDQMSVDMLTRGTYGGVGIRLGVRGDTLTVISPMEGTPAHRAGMIPGDKIIRIDSLNSLNMSLEDAAEKIRGKPGTEVTLTITRVGEKKPLMITLVREEIRINDMPYYGMDDGIAYIRVTRFSKDTAEQFREAVGSLQVQGMEGLILDLRGNPGGLLQDAVTMVDALVEPGLTIVSTRGRTNKATQSYISKREPALDPDIPLAILVDGGSASASEIVAGAIQDLDRGVIIGRRTFGKGLVQTILPVGQNTSLKLTTAKYYIPSGRLIQKEDYRRNGVFVNPSSHLNDGPNATDTVFTTIGGRPVKGGGGITPDIEVEMADLGPMTSRLYNRSLFFAFATQSQNKYSLDLPVIITDEIVRDFRAFVISKDVQITIPGEDELTAFEESLQHLEDFEGEVDLSGIKDYYDNRRLSAFDNELDQIKRGLRLEFTANLGGIGERIHTALDGDPGYMQARKVLTDQVTYRVILQPNEQTAHQGQ